MQTKFPDRTKAEWLARVEKDLKGKPLDSLNWEVEGKVYSPFWHGEDLPEPPASIQRQKSWKIGFSIPFSSFENSNKLALQALSGGANFLRFDYPGAISDSQKETLLAGIFTEIIDLEYFDIIKGGRRTYERSNVTEFLKVQADVPWENPRVWLTIDNDFFQSIAFIRAVRCCIGLINTTLGLSRDCELGVIVTPQQEVTTDYRKISNTSKAMAAIIGGADILIVEAADGTGESAFERRIARNIQHLLAEESYLGRVADPSAGSYYLENLTDTIAESIWAEFQKLSEQSA